MTTSLLETARSNRIAALAYLQTKKAGRAETGEVLCLTTMREKLRQKPIFLTRRIHRFEERVAA